MSMEIRYVTYGNKRFSKSRDRIVNEANNLNYFNTVTAYTDESIKKIDNFNTAMSNPEFAEAFSTPRGGGYWLWKPLIIGEELKKMNDGDILFYTDAGCVIPNKLRTVHKFKKYVNVVKNHETGVLVWRNLFKELELTKSDIFEHFDVLENEDVYNTRQIAANRIVIRKCEQSVKILNLWWDTAAEHTHLFTDKKSKIPELDGFIKTRHDTSVWSVICKKYSVAQDYDWFKHVIQLARIRN